MPHSQINLLPKEKVAKATSNPVLTWYSRVGIYILLFVYAVALAGFGYRWYREREFAAVRSEIEVKAEAVRKEAPFIKEYKELQNSYKVLGEIDKGGTPTVDYLRFLRATIPEPIQIETLSLSDGHMEITALSREYGAINQWYRSIESGRLLIADAKFAEDLIDGTVPEKLVESIISKGFALSLANVQVTNADGGGWVLSDGRRRFLIRTSDEGLEIFPEPALFSSIQMNRVERNLTGEGEGGLIGFSFQITY